MMKRSAIGGILLCTLQALFWAAPDAHADAIAELRQTFVSTYGPFDGITPAETIDRIFKRHGGDSVTFSKEKLKALALLQLSWRRSQTASFKLRHDLNGDLALSRTELEESIKLMAGEMHDNGLSNQQLQRTTDEFMLADADKDGVLSGKELYAEGAGQQLSSQLSAVRDTSGLELLSALLALDPNNDGLLTKAEATELSILHLQDLGPEIESARKRRSEQVREQQMLRACPYIQPASGSLFHAVGVFNGGSLSPVALGGQEQETGVVTIAVEPGDQPITLLLKSDTPTLWRIRGAVARIAKAYVLDGGRMSRASAMMHAAGTIGLPKDKVEFLQGTQCLSKLYTLAEQNESDAAAFIAKMAGRKPDAVSGGYEVDILKLPSGVTVNSNSDRKTRLDVSKEVGIKHFAPSASGKLRPLTDEELLNTYNDGTWLHFQPFGIADIDIAEIVTPSRPEVYETLPGTAGLKQLQELGKIEKMKGGAWKIKSSIRLPSGLSGAKGTSFFLPKGIAPPKGDLGTSCIKYEDKTLEPAKKRFCMAIISD